jgi:hypothetical protein
VLYTGSVLLLVEDAPTSVVNGTLTGSVLLLVASKHHLLEFGFSLLDN